MSESTISQRTTKSSSVTPTRTPAASGDQRHGGAASSLILPDVASTPLMVIRFSAQASDQIIALVSDRLCSEGLIILSATSTTTSPDNNHESNHRNNDNHGNDPNNTNKPSLLRKSKKASPQTILTITTTQQCLEETAEAIHLVKRTNDGIMERFTVKERHRFLRWSSDDPSSSSLLSSSKTKTTTATTPRDSIGLFIACEWYLLLHQLLERIKVIPFGEHETDLSKLLWDDYNIDCHVHLEEADTKRRILPSAPPKSRKDKKNRDTFRRHQEQSEYLIHVLQANGLVDAISATHLPALRDRIFWKTWKWNHLSPPSDAIQNYYGWTIAYYFAWMGFLTKWLVFPGIAGWLVVLLRWYRGDTLDEDQYTPFYGLLTFLWAVLFLRFWERHEKRLAYKWGTCLLTDYERQKFFGVRPSFRGYLRVSPITGEPEVFYPVIWRRLKYVGSAIVTLAMLGAAFTVMVLSLNLQGYIRPKSNPTRWDESSPHPFHVAMLAGMAEASSVFDATSWWRSLIPAVIHVACINVLNKIYRIIAEYLTDWENHETELSHQNSYALKRFLFEAFDCYIALFYLAFYERDVERLRMELVTIFQIDTIRRVTAECLVPMMLLLVGSHITPDLPRKNGEPAPAVPSLKSIQLDLEKDVYDQFDDYMEILIQFGYTTLFASAYPLASLVSIAANWVEIRMDLFKLSYLHQRPFPDRISDLGIWRSLLSCLVWMSALTNCLLAGFTSDQLMHYLPSFYIHDRSGFTTLEHDRGWLLIFVIFGLERLLLILGVLVYRIVPEVPEDVTNELERRHFLHLRRVENRRSSMRLKKYD